MDIWPEFKTRDFADPLGFPEVTFDVQRYGWHAIGGPNTASITAYGEAWALWELLNWLRAPVEIVDAEAAARWWGYVHEVRVAVGAITVGVTLDSMFNRVAVTYSYVPAGSATVGTRATTSWAQDDDSVSAFGTKELLSSTSGETTASADHARDTLLAALKHPIPTVTPGYGRSSLSATLALRGWWHTLGWTYYENAGTTSTVTTAQIADIVTAEGQFLEGTDVVDASGLSSSEYREGDGTALKEVEALLKKGTTNDRRLLAEVTRDRYLRVYEEPEMSSSNVEVYLDNAGVLSGKWSDLPLGPDVPPVGKWCTLKDWPSQVDMGLLADPSTFLIEAAEYDVKQQAWTTVTPRGAPTAWELVTVSEG